MVRPFVPSFSDLRRNRLDFNIARGDPGKLRAVRKPLVHYKGHREILAQPCAALTAEFRGRHNAPDVDQALRGRRKVATTPRAASTCLFSEHASATRHAMTKRMKPALRRMSRSASAKWARRRASDSAPLDVVPRRGRSESRLCPRVTLTHLLPER